MGHLIHFLREQPESKGGVKELRSVFWLGDVKASGGGWVPSFLINSIGNSWFGRSVLAPLSLGRDIHKHCYEEMSCLAANLAELYTLYKDTPCVASSS